MIRKIDTSGVMDSVKENQDSVETIKAVASVRIESIAENSSFRQATAVKSPDLFRIEILAVFGKTIGVLVSDGEKVYLRTARDSMVFENSEAFNLSYFYPGIPREITTDVLADILLGRVPFGLWVENYSVDIDRKSRLLRISYTNSLGTTSTLLIDPLETRVKKAFIDLKQEGKVEIDYNDFGLGGIETFPRVTEVRAGNYMLKLSYTGSVDINKKLDDTVFAP